MADVLVTGGCGFIGHYLVAALLDRGERVRVFDIADPLGFPPEVEFIRGSILDEALVSVAMAGVSRVYHLAAIAHLWAPQREDFDRLNAGGTKVILRAAVSHGIDRLVHCSTGAILLPPRRAARDAVDETVLPPESEMAGPYTRSKHRAECAALDAARNGLDVVIVNPTIPVGARDPTATPPTAMLSQFVNGTPPFFLDCVLNLADVRDLAHGIILAGQFGRLGERYILGGENVPMRRLLQLLEAASRQPMPKRAVPAAIALAMAAFTEWMADRVTRRRPAATREGVRLALRSRPFDCGKAQQELGYSPRPIGHAVTEAVHWLQASSTRDVTRGNVSKPELIREQHEFSD